MVNDGNRVEKIGFVFAGRQAKGPLREEMGLFFILRNLLEYWFKRYYLFVSSVFFLCQNLLRPVEVNRGILSSTCESSTQLSK